MTPSQPILAPESAVQPRKRILLADDDSGIRESLGKLLRNAGYQVVPAAHGGQVLQFLFGDPFDLLLLDLNMPEIDGWQTLEHIAASRPELPVVVITAQSDQAQWAADRGARVLMEKPLDLPLLLRTVEELVAEPPVSRLEARCDSPRPLRHYPSNSAEMDLARRCRGWGTQEPAGGTRQKATTLEEQQ